MNADHLVRAAEDAVAQAMPHELERLLGPVPDRRVEWYAQLGIPDDYTVMLDGVVDCNETDAEQLVTRWAAWLDAPVTREVFGTVETRRTLTTERGGFHVLVFAVTDRDAFDQYGRDIVARLRREGGDA